MLRHSFIAALLLIQHTPLFPKDSLVSKITKEADSHIGEKYVWGGNTLGKGVDCSSFVRELYKKHGFKLPRRAVWQAVHTKSCPTYYDFSDLRVGDTVYFQKKTSREIDHVALITGFNQEGLPVMTHAKSKKDGIVKEVMSKKYASRAVAIKRFAECTSPLGKGFQNKEVAAAIVYYAKKNNVSKEDIYTYLIQQSDMRPTLIRVRLYDKDKSNKLMAYLYNSKRVLVNYDKNSGNIVLAPKKIKTTIQIAKELKENGYIFHIGIAGIDSRKVSMMELEDILYPHINIGKAFDLGILNFIKTQKISKK